MLLKNKFPDRIMTSFVVTVTKGNLSLPIHQRFKTRFKEKRAKMERRFLHPLQQNKIPGCVTTGDLFFMAPCWNKVNG